MDQKSQRDAIDQLLKNRDDILKFSFDDEEENLLDYEDPNQTHFYDTIEKKLDSLKKSGIEDDEINNILNIDIEKHFHKYIGNLPGHYKRDEIQKVVDSKILDITDYILKVAGTRLNKIYDEKIYFALALHLHSSIERIRGGGKIFHPKLNVIRVAYSDAFLVAMELAKEIDEQFDIEVSLDEIGYLTMFLATNPYEIEDGLEQKVTVLVMMHGNSTASSMAAVANQLVGEDHVQALDMPLSMKASDMYEIAKAEIQRIHKGRGVLLLVDMGSLNNFGEMLTEETGIMVKTLDMVSTPIVMEACRKAVLGRDLFEIYHSCIDDRRGSRVPAQKNTDKQRLIITACFTGEGASERLKTMILSDLKGESIDIRPLNVTSKSDFINTIHVLSEDYIIIGIVSTIPIQMDDYLVISAVDYLSGKSKALLNSKIKEDAEHRNIALSLKDHITVWEADELVEYCSRLIHQLMKETQIHIGEEVKTGMLLHLCFLVERRIKNEPPIRFEGLNEFKNEQHLFFKSIQKVIERFSAQFSIHIEEDEIAHLLRMLLENGQPMGE